MCCRHIAFDTRLDETELGKTVYITLVWQNQQDIIGGKTGLRALW